MDSTPPTNRALVLGGGGSTGNAWLVGVIAGLHQAGLDVTDADLVVGTSAGATAAAQVTGADPARLLARTLSAAPAPRPAGPGPERASGSSRQVTDHLGRITGIIAAATDPVDLRRRLVASSLELDAASDGAWTSRWRSIVAARLPGAQWPDRRMLITAVDARTAVPVEFDRDSGVDLVDAVAASCSSGLPYRIGDRAFVDGGYRRSAENADLAQGYGRVLVLSPLGGRTLAPSGWGLHLAAQVEELCAGGSRVETIVPGADEEHLFGAAAMDPSLRPAAARAGHHLGLTLADRLADHWR